MNTVINVPGSLRFGLGDDPQVVGLYANFLRLLDAKEWWVQGDPEVEIHVSGKRNGPSGQPVDYQCSGETASDAFGYQPGIRDYAYVFDMNDNFWQGQEVRILNGAQLDSLQSAEPDGFNVSMWEDDDAQCAIRQPGTNFFQNAVNAAALIARGVNAVRTDPMHGPDYPVLAGIIGQIASLLNGGDGYLGLLVFKDSTSYAGTNPGNTHMIYDHSTLNGRATLYVKRTTRSVSMSGLSYVPAYGSNQWTTSITGSSGTPDYTWFVDGSSQQSGASSSFTYQNAGSNFELGVIVSDASGILGTAGSFVIVSACSDPTVPEC